MRNQLIQKSILTILNRLDNVFLREATLAAEVEIAIERPLTTAEFNLELLELERTGLVERDHTLLGERMWHITGKGKLAQKGL